MVKINHTKIIDYFLYGIGFFSTMYIVRIHGIPLSTILSMLCMVYLLLSKCSISMFNSNISFLGLLITSCVSNCINCFLPKAYSFQFSTSMNRLFFMVVLFLFVEQLKTVSDAQLRMYVNGLKASCVVHIIWAFLQYVTYYYMHMDINQIVFVDIMHLSGLEDGASAIENGKLLVSGLCWHPSNLAPTLLLSVLLFKKWYVWAIAFFVAAISDNGTTMIVLLSAFGMTALHYSYQLSKSMFQNRIHIKKKFIFLFPILMIALVICLIIVYPLIQQSFYDIVNRVSEQNDSSTRHHIRYYTAVPYILSQGTLLEKLFGCGLGRSGFLFSLYYHQYSYMDYWIVESDPMNYLYCTGIIGFIFLYIWLIVGLVKGCRLNYCYAILLLCIMIGGVTYTMQYQWVIELELFVMICIKRKINIFEPKSKNVKVTKLPRFWKYL